MKHGPSIRIFLGMAFVLLGLVYLPAEVRGDPSKYPKYAQQQLPKGVDPDFIYLSQLTDEITAGKKPLIVDVRSKEEYSEVHIKGSISIPLDDVPNRLTEFPKNRLIVLY
jgi:3-mercaptopyruvate sulfurtransferase SseA